MNDDFNGDDYENDSFAKEDDIPEDGTNEDEHQDEYENDSFIIEDNGYTNDRDLTSSSASSLSEDEVSN